MLWFILGVAVLNMAAGFALAVLLGRNTAGNAAEVPAFPTTDEYAASDSDDIDRGFSGELAMDAPEAPPTENTSEAAREENDDSESVLPEGPREEETASENSVMSELDAAVSAALGDVALPESETKVSTPEEESQIPRDDRTDLLQAYQSQLEDFCEELAAFDDRLRRKPPAETAELQAELDSMSACCQKQGEACQEAEQSLRGMIAAETINEKEGEGLLAAVQEGQKEAAETVGVFEKLNLETDPEGQCEIAIERTAHLLDTNYDLRDQVSDMILASQAFDVEEATNAKVDPLTEIMSRAALDATLAEHWRKDPHHVRAVSLTVLDLDQFAKFNRNHGPTVGNRVLRALAQLLESESPSDCHIARFSGQQFALLSIDRDLKQAVSDAERMRQIIETVKLEYGENDLEITVSCGVVAAGPDDTQATFFARAIESVQEAKRYGRNRTFVHEGEYPTPVVPPNFTLNEKHVTV